MNFKRRAVASLALTILATGFAHGQLTKNMVITGSSIECETMASGQVVESSRSAIVAAVVSAIDTACGGYDSGYVERLEVAYFGWAKVFAGAITKATARCKSSGNAYGCAAALSYAKSVSQATVVAFASAAADTAAKCQCLPVDQAAAFAKTFGVASTFNRITAEASSLVSTAVCVKNGEAASASIFQICLASATSKVFAKATVDFLATTSCYTADALGKIKAVTGVTTYITEGCVKNSTQAGTGSTATLSGGKGFASVEDFFSTVG